MLKKMNDDLAKLSFPMRFISLLNTKTATVICILIAVSCRIVNVLFVSFIGRDKIILMQQSRNLLEGKGLSIARYFIQNTETPVYDYTPFWPPGYPMLLAPFLKIFDYDVYWATTSLDLIFAVAFIFLVRKIVIELNFPAAAVNIMTLVAGCFDYAFISKSLPTDIPAFVLFLVGLLMFIRIIKNEKFQGLHLFLASIFLFLPCTFRYSYPPLSIGVPLAVIFLGWHLKRGMLRKKGFISLVIVSALVITFLVLLKNLTGSAGYIVDTGRGFFPENFIHWTPFVTESFINRIFSTSQLINKTGISVRQSLRILELLSAGLSIGLIIVFFLLFFKKNFFKQGSYFSNFLLIGFIISAATCASLIYLTITYKPQPSWGNYLGEPRYFMFINLFLQIAFIGWVFLYPSWKKSTFQKAVVLIFSLILFIEITHNIYFHTKVVISPGKYVAPDEEPDYVYFISVTDSISRSNPDADILVVSDNDEFFPLMTNYLGHKGIYDGDNMLKTGPAVNRKTILILALYDMEMAKYQSFLTERKAQFLNRVGFVNFYKVELLP
ncbi:MAG TPA: hypothetical protein VFT15_16590 [Chitinophagaceae bacterium]|nr:hypothetical protein [Chitinophagaceae bacterium]